MKKFKPKPTCPIKPIPPDKMVPSKKERARTSWGIYDDYSLKEFVSYVHSLSGDLSDDNIIIEFDQTTTYYDDVIYELVVSEKILVENKNYILQSEYYEKRLQEYKKDYILYKRELEKWKEWNIKNAK